MLTEIREHAQGWLAWVIVILITIPFALWGIQSYLGVGAEPVAASVNGAEITDRQLDQSLQRARMEMRERLGDAYDPALFQGAALREQVLDQLIRQQLLLDTAQALGLRVADAVLRAAIAGEPAFQQDGRFSKTAYSAVLHRQGLTSAGFEQNLRLGLLETQLERAVAGSAFATAAETDQSIRLIRQQRELRFATLPQSDFTPEAPPSEADARAFYDENPASFTAPEQVRVSYVLLSPETLGGDVEVTEADLRALYQDRADTLKTPERRQLRHILIAVSNDADQATSDQAQARAVAIGERLASGEAFEAIAAEASDDPLSADKGGDLGRIERGMLDPSLEQVAFKLTTNQISEPVRSRFGYHLVEVTAIEPAEVPSYEDVKDQLRQELQARSAEGAFYDVAERLATLTYEIPDSLVPAAEELKLEIQTSDWFGREGGEDPFANPKTVGAAFSDDVLTMGNNSELIEPDPQRLEALVLRVDEHRPESRRPFDEVRSEIIALLESREAASAALAAATALASRVEQGETLEAACGDACSAKDPGLIDRQAADIPAAVVTEAFVLPRPAQDKKTVGTAVADNGDAYVVVVASVKDGSIDDLPADARPAEARVLARGLGRSDFDLLVAGLEARAKIERKAPEPDSVSE